MSEGWASVQECPLKADWVLNAMTLWDDYEIFDPQVDRPLAEVTPAEARAHYALVVDTKEQRVAELKKLARAARIELDDSEETLHASTRENTSAECPDGDLVLVYRPAG
jgi:hypothetical protein